MDWHFPGCDKCLCRLLTWGESISNNVINFSIKPAYSETTRSCLYTGEELIPHWNFARSTQQDIFQAALTHYVCLVDQGAQLYADMPVCSGISSLTPVNSEKLIWSLMRGGSLLGRKMRGGIQMPTTCRQTKRPHAVALTTPHGAGASAAVSWRSHSCKRPGTPRNHGDFGRP